MRKTIEKMLARARDAFAVLRGERAVTLHAPNAVLTESERAAMITRGRRRVR